MLSVTCKNINIVHGSVCAWIRKLYYNSVEVYSRKLLKTLLGIHHGWITLNFSVTFLILFMFCLF